MKVVKVTSKGQVTIPIEIREELAITEDTYLEVDVEKGEVVRMRKRVAVRPLGDSDPIWDLVGTGQSGTAQTSEDHDRALAKGESRGWRGSS